MLFLADRNRLKFAINYVATQINRHVSHAVVRNRRITVEILVTTCCFVERSLKARQLRPVTSDAADWKASFSKPQLHRELLLPLYHCTLFRLHWN